MKVHKNPDLDKVSRTLIFGYVEPGTASAEVDLEAGFESLVKQDLYQGLPLIAIRWYGGDYSHVRFSRTKTGFQILEENTVLYTVTTDPIILGFQEILDQSPFKEFQVADCEFVGDPPDNNTVYSLTCTCRDLRLESVLGAFDKSKNEYHITMPRLYLHPNGVVKSGW